MVESDRIYVQVPAYRDPELLPTLVDMMRTASEPGRLVVAVAWQYGADEERLAGKLERLGVRLLAIAAADSQGCNWARNLLQQGWAGEEYTRWLDSHHRFAPGWDASALLLPAAWWHWARSLSVSISVTFSNFVGGNVALARAEG